MPASTPHPPTGRPRTSRSRQGRHWKAWVATPNTEPKARSGSLEIVEYRKVDGTPITTAGIPSSLSTLDAPLDRNEKNDQLGSDDVVWTGTGPGGVGDTCSGWTSLAGAGQVGDPLAIDNRWANLKTQPCSSDGHFYCFEVP